MGGRQRGTLRKEDDVGNPDADREYEAWRYLCGRLESVAGKLPPDATVREADESDLMDAIRGWGNALVAMKLTEIREG